MLGDQTATAMEARSAVTAIKALRAQLADRRAVAARAQSDLSRTQLETAKAEVSRLPDLSHAILPPLLDPLPRSSSSTTTLVYVAHVAWFAQRACVAIFRAFRPACGRCNKELTGACSYSRSESVSVLLPPVAAPKVLPALVRTNVLLLAG